MVNRQGFLSEYILQIYQLINSLRLIWAFLYSRLVWSVYRKIAMANRSHCIFDNLRDISEEFRPFKRFHNKNEYRSYFNVPLSEICVKKLCQNSVQLKMREDSLFLKKVQPVVLYQYHIFLKKWEVHIWSTYISISNVHFGYNG